jgi:gliding motility-associated-like protein
MKISTHSVLGILFLSVWFLGKPTTAISQTHLPECSSDVPLFEIDLSSNPDSTYTTPGNIVRQTTCCGTGDRYVSFYVTMHPDVAAFEIYEDGAPAFGSASYTIISGGDLTTPGVCGTKVGAGNSQCIVGPGPHKILYDKPGSNSVRYSFRQIPKPIFPDDQFTRVGCSKPINIYGLKDIVIQSVNSSTGNTTPGAYNNLLSCSDCDEPVFTPGLATPEWIDYEVCGAQIASTVCGIYATCGTFRVYTSSPLSLNASPNPASFCDGGPGVELTATGAGGDGNYFYVWRDSDGNILDNSNIYNATTQGIYTIELGDGLNSPTCPSEFLSVPVSVAQPPIVDAGIDQTICATSPTAFLAGSVENATGGSWLGGTGTFNPDNNSLLVAYTASAAEINAGFVTLTLTSTGAGGGCVDDSDEVTIFFSDTVFVNPSADPIACSGDETTIFSNASGGTAPFSYFWSNGQNTANITASAGTYSVMVLDQFGCGQGASITINNPDQLLVSTSTTPTTGVCDGTATVNISGGVAPYTVQWSDPANQTTATATGLCSGLYTATIIDANGCQRTVSVVVNDPLCNNLNISITSFTDATCYGLDNGSAVTETTGGDGGPFTYSWNTIPEQTTPNASNLSAGVYEVTVTDASTGCDAVTTVTITHPPIITNVITSTNASSIGGTDGEATANPSGGTPPYEYLWTPGGQTTQTAENLSAGTYFLEIEDALGCIKEDSVLINQPPCNNFIIAVTPINISCNGLENGSASVIAAHGTPPYAIEWQDALSNVIATDVMSVSGLAAGSYTVQVTDQSNCTTFQTFDITEPDALSVGLIPNNVSCFGAANGTIDLNVLGGTFPYTFEWFIGTRPIGTSEDLINLSPGTYSVIVTDANGCTVSGSVGITQPALLQASVSATDITCFGAEDGTVTGSALGGIAPYNFEWVGPNSFNASTAFVENLQNGLYELTVTDANNCEVSLGLDIFVNEPAIVEILDIAINCPNPGDNEALVEVIEIAGGDEGPYQISWDNGLTYSPTGVYTQSLATGTIYNVVAIDGNGCETPISFNLDLNSIVEIDTVVFDYCIPLGATQIPIEVVANGGTGQYEVSLDGGTTFNVLGDYIFNVAVASSYSIVVRDEDGCESVAYGITVPAELVAIATLDQEVSCIGESDGAVSLAVSGGTTPYTYEWSLSGIPFSVDQTISGLVEGTYEVLVTDFYGCTTSTSIFVSTFPDATDPEISCPTSISVSNDPGVCTAEVTYATPVGTDNCPGAFTTLVQGLASGSLFPVGITTVEYEVEDLAGNTASCSFTVQVIDNELPTITCPSDVSAVSDLDECTVDAASVNLGTPVTSDNCGIASVVNNAPTSYPVGTTTVTWTATDVHGNSNTCQQLVVVEDTQAPVISSCGVIGSILVDADAGVCTYTHSGAGWDVEATDNCTNITVEYALSGATTGIGTSLDGVTFNPGTTTVLWTVTDDANNVSTCSFTVTIEDNEDPLFTFCLATNPTVEADPGVCTYSVSGTAWDATAVDNCGSVTVTAELTGATIATGLTTLDGVAFNLGTTIVTWTATDNAGNFVTCDYTVTVEDTQDPIISSCGVIGSETVVSDAGVCTYTHTGTGWDVEATDNCTTISVAYELTGATTGTGMSLAGQVFNLGTTTVTWTVTDGSNNTTQCSFDIIVIDTQAPVISGCPTNIVLTNDAGICGAVATWDEPTSDDNCGVTSFTADFASGDVFPVGVTTVTYTAEDAAGNQTTCSFSVTVTDTELPVINDCPDNIVVSNDPGACSAVVSWVAPTAMDNCGVTSFTSTHIPGATFPVGTTTVTYTAMDAAGNIQTCSFSVTVNDDELPTIICQPPVTVVADLNECHAEAANVLLGTPVPGDNCGVASVTNNAPLFYPVGLTVVTWTITDIHGNTNSCTQNVTVIDNQAPIISSCGVVGNQTVTADAGDCSFTNIGTGWDVEATDNCTTITVAYTLSGATSGTGSTLDNVEFNLGVSTVLWTVTDAAGNVSTCTFTITVEDNEAPVIVDCSTDIAVGTDLGECGAIVTWTAPTFTDNCSGANMVASHNPGDFFAVGTTTVTYTVTDASGNVTTCDFDVVVADDELPAISCQSNIESCDPIVTYAAPTATDNCGVASVTMIAGLASGSEFPIGTTTVTYEVVDIHGNSNTCSFDVTIFDLPVVTALSTDITCNGAEDGTITLEITGGQAPYTYQWSNMETTQDIENLMPGIYSVLVTDANGCQGSAQAGISEPDVLSLENTVAHVTCNGANNGSIALVANGGVAPYNYAWSNGATTSTIEDLAPGFYSAVVTDENGCEVEFEVTITEPDTLNVLYIISNATCEAPTGSIALNVTGGTAPYLYSWSDGSSSMNLINATAGDYSVIVSDANGCTYELSLTIESETNIDVTVYTTDVSCFGRNNGTAVVSVKDGNPPYSIEWSHGPTTAEVSGLAAGIYAVTVTDDYGCSITVEVMIYEPEQLVVELTSPDLGNGYNVAPYGSSNGSVFADVFGGTEPYEFVWSNGQSTQNIFNLTAGEYTVLITDENGCVASASITLSQPMDLDMPQGISPNGDGLNDYFVVRGIDAFVSNEITIYNRWGNIVYQMNNYANEWDGRNNKGEELPDATYFVVLHVKDAAGLTTTLTGYVDLRRE